MDSGEYVIVVLLYLREAFDAVDQRLSVDGFNAIRFDGSDLAWLISYPFDRKQQTVWRGYDPCLIQFNRACLKAEFSATIIFTVYKLLAGNAHS